MLVSRSVFCVCLGVKAFGGGVGIGARSGKGRLNDEGLGDADPPCSHVGWTERPCIGSW